MRQKGRTILTEFESKQIFAAYGIPTVETRLAATPDDAVREASAIGYPVVVKLNSETITHKTDVKGVQLNLKNEADVRNAYETIRAAVTERHGAEHFQGVTVQPMIKLDGYELIVGSSVGPAVWPGAALWHRRHAGRGLQGPCAWACRRSTPRWPAA